MVEFFKGLSFFILPLGFGTKRIEFFENEIRKFGGNVSDGRNGISHVIVEDSVAEDRKNCNSALKKQHLGGKDEILYLKVTWLSKCLSRKNLVETDPYEIEWIKRDEETEVVESKSGQGEEENEKEIKSPEKKRKIDYERYVCSRPSTSTGLDDKYRPNQRIIDELEKLANAYALRKDTWRSYSYKKAINAISSHSEITSFEEARRIPGIGEKMALKIMEIVECGKLHKVDEVVDEKTNVMDVFCKVWGVGPATAEGWYAQGLRTLDDLKERAKLTKQQRIGLKYYGDFQQQIPRHEVLQIYNAVNSKVSEMQSSLRVELVGSFRRGRPTCGDVDLMIVNGGAKTSGEILAHLTKSLKAQGYLTDDLVNVSNTADNHTKYLGVFKLLGKNHWHRRIDFFVVPESEYAPALVHYTGSALFNRSLKLLAAKKNMTLTERGLYTGTLRKGSEVTCRGDLIPTPTEKDVFEQLGLAYRPPEQRDH